MNLRGQVSKGLKTYRVRVCESQGAGQRSTGGASLSPKRSVSLAAAARGTQLYYMETMCSLTVKYIYICDSS